jgi:hypothetical protein
MVGPRNILLRGSVAAAAPSPSTRIGSHTTLNIARHYVEPSDFSSSSRKKADDAGLTHSPLRRDLRAGRLFWKSEFLTRAGRELKYNQHGLF